MAAVLIDDVCAQFKRFWLNDPVIQAMDRGDILWGDIILTHEEIAFHNEWALSHKPLHTHIDTHGATAPTIISSEQLQRPHTPVFVPFDTQLETGLQSHSVCLDEESALWQPVTKPKTTRLVPPVAVGIKTLIARNLPRDITVEALRAVFERFGPIKDVYIPRNMDKTSPLYGTVKGFALIKFLKPTDSANAFTQLYGKLVFASNNVSIEFAKQDR